MARVIDKDYLLKHKRKVRFFGISPDDESWGYAVPAEIIENAPTITPPNEPLTCEGCYWKDHGSIWKCATCVREKKDNYRRPPEGEA